MRIAHVTDGYLPRVGGIEIQVRDLASRQRAAGHDVTVVTCVPETCGGPPSGDVVVRRPPARPAAGGAGAIRYGHALWGRRTVLRGGFDVVHVHTSTFSPLGFLTAAATASRRIPTAVTLHSLWAQATPLFAVADRMARWSHWPVAWSAVSDVCAAPLRAVLAGRADVAVLPNSVEPTDWSVRRAPELPGVLRLVSVLRLTRRKRPRQLLQVLRTSRASLPNGLALRVDVAGDGPERAGLERYLRRHRMTEWVTLHGYLSREQIRALYERADLFVAPATLESFGIAALEARSAGLPVIARAGTGTADFIAHGREGLLVDSDAGMARAIAQVATSPALRQGLAAYNRAVPPAGGWDDVLRRCELLYRAAAARAALSDAPFPARPAPMYAPPG